MSEKETEKLFRSITELSDDLIENAQTVPAGGRKKTARSEEHTSELQSL